MERQQRSRYCGINSLCTQILIDAFTQLSFLGEESARFFISSFFKSLAESGYESKESFTEMAEEGATPGGLNEQVHRGLLASGAYTLITDQMDGIIKRLSGREAARMHDAQEPKRQKNGN